MTLRNQTDRSHRRTAFRGHLAAWLTLAIVSVVGGPAAISGDPPADSQEFGPQAATEIEHLLTRYCLECHAGVDPEGDFPMDGILGPDVDDAPRRWHQIYEKIEQETMPPSDARQPEPDERKAFMEWIVHRFGKPTTPEPTDHWAFVPPKRPAVPALTRETSESLRPSNPIDHFVLAELERRQLDPSPVADRRTLIRRLTLNLTGLPPTPEQTQRFIDDPAELGIALESLVDRLLSSPYYGERWSQHWLDVIRWAETVGFETNAERRDAWHYRDWVINAFNRDHPYDGFISDQLLGDVSGQDAALGFLVAGPANLPGQVGRDEEAMRQARQDELDEVIQTVSQGLLGLTVGCARCHDHKFDPISQKDYYSMQAVFAGLQYGTRRLRGELDDRWSRNVPDARRRLEERKQQLEQLRQRFGLRQPLGNVQSETFETIDADAIRMEIDATQSGPASLWEFEAWSRSGEEEQNVALASEGALPSASSFALANQTRHFDNLTDGQTDRRQSFPWVSAAGGPAWIQVELPQPSPVHRITWHAGSSVPVSYRVSLRRSADGQWVQVADTDDRLPRLDDRRDPATVKLADLTGEQVKQVYAVNAQTGAAERELARLSRGPQTYAASFVAAPPATRLLARGDPMRAGVEVWARPPAALRPPDTPLPKQNPPEEKTRRSEFVRHLFTPGHPLTARVIVNRVWQAHFGTGLVQTSSDFGRMGRPPSHPQLLDWLSVELVEHGWSLKWLNRLITTSSIYRQSSHPRETALSMDAESRLLWRFPPRRLEAEAIRDSILMSSGKLNRQMGGRGFDFFNQRGGLSDYHPRETFDDGGWRRMIYAHKVRMQSVDVFGAFDCPDAGQMTPKRSRSVTPLQSLGLFNSPFVNRQAEFFAQRLRAMDGLDRRGRVAAAFEIALSRPPSEEEREVLMRLANDHGLAQACRVLLNTSEFVSLR